jgi:hypothetical protein
MKEGCANILLLDSRDAGFDEKRGTDSHRMNGKRRMFCG